MGVTIHREGRGRVCAIRTQTNGQGWGAAREEGQQSHTRSRVLQFQGKEFKFEDKSDQEFHVLTKADNNGSSIRFKGLQSVRGMAMRT